jgi:glutaconate CoA-transferase subunit A
MNNKVYSLKDAIQTFVESGDCISFGGFTTNRKPYAAVHEILRQGQRDLIFEGCPSGGELDMLIGEGRIKVYNNSYVANSGVTNVGRRFRNAVENGNLMCEDYSLDVMVMLFHAAALGLPFLPSELMMGSDLTDKWGISREERLQLDEVPNEKFVYLDNPFNPGKKILALPVPKLDTAIIHVQMASPDGTARIIGDELHDVDIAVAARKTIVTCEELISNEEIRREPSKNTIPGFCVDAVVHAPYGAHPSQCCGYYDYDTPYMKEYGKASASDEGFKEFVGKYVYGVKDHEEYLNLIGATRLIKLKTTPGFGYAADVSKEGN